MNTRIVRAFNRRPNNEVPTFVIPNAVMLIVSIEINGIAKTKSIVSKNKIFRIHF